MVAYFIDLTIVWTVLLLFYQLTLRRSTHFQWSRAYLLTALILGPTLPLLIDILPSIFSASINDDIVYSTVMLHAAEVKTASVQSIERLRVSYKEIFLLIYVVGILTSLMFFIYGILRILRIRKKGHFSSSDNFKICLHGENMAPFSFFKTIYLSKENALRDQRSILEHELAHIKGIHSIDIVVARLLSIFFWCALPVHYFHRLLSEIHEYIADKKVLDNHSYNDYLTELIHTIVPEKSVRISQSSISGNIKKRLKMMKKKKTNRWHRFTYLLSIPLIYLVLMGLTLSENIEPDSIQNKNTNLVSPILLTDTIPEVFQVVEEMPRFPGCEHIEDLFKKEDCSKEKLIEYLSENIKYPEGAKKKGTEGMVVVQFIVEPDGTIANISAIKEVGDGCTEEAIRVIVKMNEDGKKWTPGYQKGEAVRTQFSLPIKFRLNGKKTKQVPLPPNATPPEKMNSDVPLPPPPPPPPPMDDKPVFNVVEEMPYLAVCKDEKDNKAREVCNEKAMMEILYNNLTYPKIARENGIQGKVIVSFVVNTDGTTSDHKILRDVGANCGEAAMSAVKLLQNWVPGKQRGKAVRVQYTMPVMFKLEKGKKTE